MHLIEVVVAGSVFAVASGSSVQLWSAMAVQTHQLTRLDQLEQQIEQDRLQLQALWHTNTQTIPESNGSSASGCLVTAPELLTMASNHPAPTSLQRELELNPDGRSLRITWTAAAAPPRRTRVVTPAGLGLCGLKPDEPAATEPEETSSSGNGPMTDGSMADTPLMTEPS